MMEKMGWTAGKGLGAKEDGNTEVRNDSGMFPTGETCSF